MTRMPLLVPILLAVSAAAAGAQEDQESPDGLWRRQPAAAASAMRSQAARSAAPVGGGDVYALDRRAFDARLATAPHESRVRVEVSPAMVTLPLPDGTFGRFAVVESPIMEATLAARFPRISTYALAGLDRPALRGRLDATPEGVRAIVLTGTGAALIDPLPDSAGVLYTSHTDPGGPVLCGVEERRGRQHAPPEAGAAGESRSPWTVAAAANASGAVLRTYRMAVATTGEYYRARGNNDADVLASIVALMNRVNLIFQTEVAISFVIAAGTTDVFFTDPDADGYTNDVECVMRSENVAVVSGVLADESYDLAHVFGSGAGGCAGAGNVCTASKANGASNLDTSPTMPFVHDGFSGYRLVAHELGHQFGAGHTWSGTGGSCAEAQFSPDDAYEPGGGTTLMSYSGTCDWSNIHTSPADPYFHTHSFDEITEFLGGDGAMCGDVEVTGNSAPEVSAGPDHTIPRETPFVLTGSASDAEGHGVTFTWEQHDLAPGQFPAGTDPGSGPLFRSVPPGPEPSRMFPQPGDLVANTTTPGELLPETDRVQNPLTFRLTARDGFAGGGGVGYDTVQITVQGPPFQVTSPEGPAILHAGCTVPVTWDVGGGSVASRVNLSISNDGGLSYSPVAAGVPNDGARDVQLTCQTGTQGRVKVEAADGIFFDISDSDFLVVNDSPAIEAAAQGGSVDGSCQLSATFTATVTDDCGVSAGGVTVDASIRGGNADLSAPMFEAEQIDARTVGVAGRVVVSNVANGAATVQFAVGAADACGQSAEALVTAEAADTTPPAIAVSLTPGVLWPANHKLVDVTATVTATDNCPGVRYVLTSVTSNEPDEPRAGGNGAVSGDIHGAEVQTPDLAFQLRAERRGPARGRTYTAVYTAVDGAGNETPAAAVVTVPGGGKSR